MQVAVSDAGFVLLIGDDNKYALDAAGTAAVTGITGLTLSGTVSLQRNTNATHVMRQLVVGGVTRTLDVPAGPNFTRFGGENVVLGVLGNEVAGSFAFTADNDNISVDIENASVSLAGGLLVAHVASASFDVTPDRADGEPGLRLRLAEPAGRLVRRQRRRRHRLLRRRQHRRTTRSRSPSARPATRRR